MTTLPLRNFLRKQKPNNSEIRKLTDNPQMITYGSVLYPTGRSSVNEALPGLILCWLPSVILPAPCFVPHAAATLCFFAVSQVPNCFKTCYVFYSFVYSHSRVWKEVPPSSTEKTCQSSCSPCETWEASICHLGTGDAIDRAD